MMAAPKVPSAPKEHTPEELGGKYYMLTKELKKFIDKEDIDEFLELVKQRGTIVDMMRASDDDEYRNTPECKQMIEEIVPMDREIMYKARRWLNRSRRRNATVHAYDLHGIQPVGGILNKKY